MRKRCKSSTIIRTGLWAALIGLCVLVALGQSGRGRKSAPPPIATPEATPTPVTPSEKPKPAFTFIIGMENSGGFSRVPLYVSSGVLHACAGRLDDPESVDVEIETHDIGHAGAIQRAKSEKEAYVVWLQLVPDTLSGRAGANDDPNNVYIEYIVLAPITAKQVTSGNIFPGAYRNRGVIVSPKTSGISGDYQLNQAAKATAERILNHFHIGMVNTRP